MNESKRLTKEQALSKIRHYCSYQDRCHKEVRDKLYSFGLFKTDVEQLLTQLIEEDYLNEERFAVSFARGKFRLKGWGRTKIAYELKSKQVSSYCIQVALKQIEENDYATAIEKVAQKKWATLKGERTVLKKAKLYAFLAQRGFEPKLIQHTINQLIANTKTE